jgi:hypothetical protein
MRHRRTRGIPALALGAAITCGALAPGLSRGADVEVFAGTGDQKRVDVAAAGDTLLVVWQDGSSGYLDIRAARVDAGGTVLGTGAFDVCTAAATRDRSWPAVASDGTGFLVVWQEAAEVWAVCVAADESVARTDDFQVSYGDGSENYPDVGWTGSEYLVAWQDSRDLATTGWDIFAAHVTTGGVVQNPDASAIKVTDAGVQDAAAVAGSGGSALVVFRHGAGNDIRGALVAPDGTPGTAFSVAAPTSTQKDPTVAFGRGVYLVAWEDYRHTSGYANSLDSDIYAARVSAAGALLDATHAAVAVASDARHAAPAVAFDGVNFVVAWEAGPDGDTDVRSARIIADTGDITVREPGGLAVSAGAQDEDAPSVAPTGTGVLTVWADSRGSDPADVYAVALGTNDPPIADAGGSFPARVDTGVTLDGGASADPEGLPLTYSWVQVPVATVTLTGADTDAPEFTTPAASVTLTFELTVSDGVLTDTDQVTVTVVPLPPPASGNCGASGAERTAPLLGLFGMLALGVVVFVRRPARCVSSVSSVSGASGQRRSGRSA